MREGSREKNLVLFLVARPLRPSPPPPSLHHSSLVATFLGGIFLKLQKKSFFLSDQPPHLFVAGPLKKELFDAAFPRGNKFFSLTFSKLRLLSI